ncbi:hypothetical protein HBB16_10645 [Pseudonocardia sp. MCCB 268]|nr:hypothetical protein [Pseudonocardia cytotoxica]
MGLVLRLYRREGDPAVQEAQARQAAWRHALDAAVRRGPPPLAEDPAGFFRTLLGENVIFAIFSLFVITRGPRLLAKMDSGPR